jgi:hypothetical protein
VDARVQHLGQAEDSPVTTKGLLVPYTDDEFRRLRAAADECGDSSVENYVRSISLATCTPSIGGGAAKARTSAPKASTSPGPGGLLILDEAQKPTKCGGCGLDTVRAKSSVSVRTYSVLLRDIDRSTTPPRAKRHLCTSKS